MLSRTPSLPQRAPRREDFDRALRELRAVCPALRLSEPVHILIGSTSRPRVSQWRRVHTCVLEFPGRSFHAVGKGIYVATPALALVQMMAGREFVSSLELLWEACGTYQTYRTVPDETRYNVQPLTCVQALRSYVERGTLLNGTDKVSRLIRYLADGSASPQETKCALLLGLPKQYGGYGLGIPRMNHCVKASASARAIAGRSSFRLDLCWPEARIDVEYQSFETHGNEASRLRDSRRANALDSMGWAVVSITNGELSSLPAMDVIAQTVRKRMRKHVSVYPADHHARKLRLRRHLGIALGYD